VPDRRARVATASGVEFRPRANQPLGGKERHLGIVGDRPDATIGLGEVPKAGRSEASPDAIETVELYRRAQRVAYGTPKEAAREAG
jgi:hypothetical protein